MAFISANSQLHHLMGQASQLYTNVRYLASSVIYEPRGQSVHQKDKESDQLPEKQKDNPISVYISSPDINGLTDIPFRRKHWDISYKSADSFYDNIRSVKDEALSQHAHAVCSHILSGRPILGRMIVKDLVYQQAREFKTRRSGSVGLGSGASSRSTPFAQINPVKVPASLANNDADSVRQRIGYGKNETSEFGLNKITKNTKLSEDEEKELKIAFADGYHADWKKLFGGGKMLPNKILPVMAFAEGYYSSANRSKTTEKKVGLKTKLLSVVLAVSIVFMVLVMTSTISIRKVQLFNGEQYEINPETVAITFDDVRGSDEAKAELRNVVDFLKNPKRYTDLGAKLPKGCLLVGPPGVGKTLLAKAVAGEAGVPFFQASGAEFDEVFVGTGAKRVRQLFRAAKMKTPCVIFIDEIDSVGGKRTSSEMHPYANQTINQLLTEMDGFQSNEGVIVLGATNKRENLDKALLRPGRFDVEVNISPPDLRGRQDILQLYLPKMKTDGNVDVAQIAKQTTGCTGADLYNICNQAAMKAAIDGKLSVTMKDIEYAIDKVTMGPQKKRLSEQVVNRMTAYHEAGHALVKYYCHNGASRLHKISILPRGPSLGMTHFIHEEKREFQYTKEQMLHDLDALMGGRVAEELIFGENQVSTGASSDMRRATSIAENMVKQYGFSDKAGLRVYPDTSQYPISLKLQEEIDEEIKTILKDSYDRCKKLLQSRKKELGLLAEALFEYEELSYDEAKIIIEGGKLQRPGYAQPSQQPQRDDKTPSREEKKDGPVNLLTSRKY